MSYKREIKCPKCGAFFQLDESNYNELLNQIKDKEVAEKVDILKAQLEIEYKLKLNSAEKKYDELLHKTNNLAKDYELKNLQNLNNLKEKNDKEINHLKEENHKLLLENKDNKMQYDKMEKLYQNEIQNYKDFNARLNSKVLGEKLEQYCYNEFNKIRPIAYPNAKFYKDNEVSDESHSKGDFIFRNYSDDGIEYISIMFEMKNEQQVSKTKQKNEHFFKELDKDRKEKKCEYAILVSELEMDNDLYNSGILNVSYSSGYEKMYVVRPNYFVTIIGLLDNAAKNTIDYKQQLVAYNNRDIDITNFENDLKKWKEGFSNNFNKAENKFNKAIKEIDKTINTLTKIKENLMGSEKQLTYANDKIRSLTIRKLTNNNPTMKEKFNRLKDKNKK